MNAISAPGAFRSTPSLAPPIQSSLTLDPQRQPSIAQDNPVSLDNPAALKTAFGDSCNWKTLAQKLQAILESLSQRFAQGASPDPTSFAADLALCLNRISIPVCEDSTYYREHALTPQSLVSLQSYLQGCGLSVPTSWAELVDLNQRITRRAQVHPLGNFSGALAWPIPLGSEEQRSIIALMQSANSGLPGLPLVDEHKGALGYLLSGSTVSDADLRTPTLAIEKLLGSTKAQALGQSIQMQLGGYATPSSVNEYLLAAIHLGLDPECLDAPAANTVAGFDLAGAAHWGQPPQTVIDKLGRHLLEQGRVTAQSADLGARLLLAKTAPEFLVKTIPPSVTYGSLTWAQLAIATARIEADSPGRSLNLSYAQVLAHGEQVNTHPSALQGIQQKALSDWGKANGLLTGDTCTETLRIEFNRQLQALTTASSQVQTSIPSRREMALNALRAAFPDLDPKHFETPSLVRVFRVPGRTGQLPGMRSMLDVVMHDGKLGDEEHWESADKRIPAKTFCNLIASRKLDVAASFKAAYDQAITSIEQGQQGVADYLISTLAPQDRKNFECGQLEFFHTNDYTMAMDLFSKPTLSTRGHTLRVKTTLNGEVNIYEIDTRRATIEKQNYWIRRYTPPYTAKNLEQLDANVISKTVLFDPFKEQADQAKERSASNHDNPKFGSTRSAYIGRVFAKSLDLRNDDLLQHARGVTSFDKDAATSRAVAEFFLNLIPLRSAIVNFSNGDIADGVFDLGLDFIGLLTLGAGKAAQAGKAFAKGISTVSGVSKILRFLGASAIAAVNPLGGLGDLVGAGARLIDQGARRLIAKGLDGVNRLRGAAGSYDLLKAASREYEVAAIGTFERAGQTVEAAAVLRNGKWYGFDVDKMHAFGGELENFSVKARAVDGVMTRVEVAPGSELNNALFGEYKVPESTVGGRTPNSQGVYVGADGHLSHIRHTDGSGQTAVYEVREVSRTPEGAVQARIYSGNRQTPLLVQHVQGDQWLRLGARGGNPSSIAADMGRMLGGGAEGVVYESLDGVNVYKEFRQPVTSMPHYVTAEVQCVNRYYGKGFATAILENGRAYIKMKKLSGVNLGDIPERSLPPEVRGLMVDVLADMEAKKIFHNDLQLTNFLYSAADKKVYPVDIQALEPDVLERDAFLYEMTLGDYGRAKAKLIRELNELIG